MMTSSSSDTQQDARTAAEVIASAMAYELSGDCLVHNRERAAGNVLAALADAGYRIVGTLVDDYGYCPMCHKWYDQRPVISSPEMGANSYRQELGGQG